MLPRITRQPAIVPVRDELSRLIEIERSAEEEETSRHILRSVQRALREARECVGAVQTAQMWGYVGACEAALDRMDKIVATLHRLTRSR